MSPATKKVTGPKKKRKKSRRRKSVDPQKQIARRLMAEIRTTLTHAGFTHFATRNKNITVNERTGEVDGLYLYQNVMLIIEDTTRNAKGLSDHLRKTKDFFDHLREYPEDLIEVLMATDPEFKKYCRRNAYDSYQHFKVCFVYCSQNDVETKYRNRFFADMSYLSRTQLMYFHSLTKTLRKTAKFELLSFLGLEFSDVGDAPAGTDHKTYEGILLPEAVTSFPKKHRLVTFLIDPQTLMSLAYVLRADSWRDSDCLYQRLLVKNKIKSMRKYLVDQKRVFVNNIIATLPDTTEIRKSGRIVGDKEITKVEQVSITIPKVLNCIGIIDGQHRLFCYHEGKDKHESKISTFRERQNLLVTGIVYPKDFPESKKQQFEAKLFLEINDKQKKVKGDLKQAIERIVNPYSSVAIAKAVLDQIGTEGSLQGLLEIHFFDTGKIKTTSIVSYGLRHIVGFDAENSLYSVWSSKHKKRARKNKDALELYVQYCASRLDEFFNAFKEQTDDEMWTMDKKKSRLLSTTTINGLIYCFRLLIRDGKLSKFKSYLQSFAKLNVDFSPEKFDYKSSHWKALGEKIYKDCFS